MKIFRTLRAARKFAPDKPIVRIDSGPKTQVFVVVPGDAADQRLCSVDLIAPGGVITGHVNLGHLDRLGNANWAIPGDARSNHSRIWSTPGPSARTA